ncbi:MAG: tail fiber domain-containing protein [Bacteroidetes bacterium]|nr:tail fiber domain-containing protein [Bacteroidota bacterium]
MKTTRITKTFLAIIIAGMFNILKVYSQNPVTTVGLSAGSFPYAITTTDIEPTQLMYQTVNNVGYVGIGQSSPYPYRLNVNGNSFINGTITSTGHNNNNGGITNAGAISGITSLSSTGVIISIGHNNNNGGITNAGAISGASTITASGAITSTGHNNNNGGITNAGAISGATTISATNVTASQIISAGYGINNNNASILNTGAIYGATDINASGAFSGATTITASGTITGAAGIFNTKVGINASSPLSPLSIGGAGFSNWSAYAYNPGTTSSQGIIYATCPAPTAGGNYYGITGSVPAGAGNTYGVTGSAASTTAQSGSAIGVYGYAKNGSSGQTIGVIGWLDGSSNGAGVVGSTSGFPSIPAQYAGYFVGQILTTNDSPQKPNSGSWTGYSDKRLKKDIIPFTDGLEVLRKVNPISYKFNGIGNLPTTKTNIGVVAQDIQKVAPYCVGTGKLVVDHADAQNFGADVVKSLPADSSGKAHDIIQALTYNYDGLIYVLINSVKQLDSIVTAQHNEIAALKGASPQLRMAQNSTITPSTNVELAGNSAILYQNAPNPFDDGTTIRYFVPENSIGASMIFYDEFGSQIKNAELTNTGVTAELNLSTMNLAVGVYSYSLIVNGKAVDTKKMIKSK